MTVRELFMEDLRTFRRIDIEVSSRLNVICGPNASGKTTLLEGLYFLGRARSFRTRRPSEMIRRGAQCFRVAAGVEDAGRSRRRVAVEQAPRSLQARVGGRPASGLSELADELPLLLVNAHSHSLLEAGPEVRRRFMDWGAFNLESAFLDAWRRYRRVLGQRNRALRLEQSEAAVRAWDPELAVSCAVIDGTRRSALRLVEEALAPVVERLLGEADVRLEYRPGWPPEEDISEALRQGLVEDRRAGYTRFGPHRAEFVVKLGGIPATRTVSRGQQKALVSAMVMSQAKVLSERRRRRCVLLIDDLPAELDEQHRQRLLEELKSIPAQLFITAIEPEMVDCSGWEAAAAFALSDGTVRKMVY